MNWQKILCLVLLAALLAGFGFLFYEKIVKLNDLQRQQARYQATLDKLKADIAYLVEEIDGLENDPAKLEKLARDKLGMVRREEKIYIIEPTPVPPVAEK